MSDEIVIPAFEFAGGPLCVSTRDGQALHNKIVAAMLQGKKVAVSFAKVEKVIPAFLDAAVGQLYGEFSEESVLALLSVCDMADEDLPLLDLVVRNAKAYFANSLEFDEAWKDELR
jgi:hypothetical protein